MTVQCPYCDYEGMVSSVEGHISGMSDDAHRGKVGRDLREHLPSIGEETDLETGGESYPEESVEDLGPGTALVAATVVVALVVVLGAVGSDGAGSTEQTEPIEETDGDVSGAWS